MSIDRWRSGNHHRGMGESMSSNRLRAEGRAVFVCLHPTERYHLEILREICERFLFVERGRVSQHADWDDLMGDARVVGYLGERA